MAIARLTQRDSLPRINQKANPLVFAGLILQRLFAGSGPALHSSLGFERAIEDSLFAARGIFMDHPALGRLVKGGRNLAKFCLRLFEIARGNGGSDFFLSGFESAADARVEGVTLRALPAAFRCGFGIGHVKRF